jgi:hypothetical protein
MMRNFRRRRLRRAMCSSPQTGGFNAEQWAKCRSSGLSPQHREQSEYESDRSLPGRILAWGALDHLTDFARKNIHGERLGDHTHAGLQKGTSRGVLSVSRHE